MSNAVCLFTFNSIHAHKALTISHVRLWFCFLLLQQKYLRYIVVRLSAAVIVSKLSASRGCLASSSYNP